MTHKKNRWGASLLADFARRGDFRAKSKVRILLSRKLIQEKDTLISRASVREKILKIDKAPARDQILKTNRASVRDKI
jgi:hypothetical protein